MTGSRSPENWRIGPKRNSDTNKMWLQRYVAAVSTTRFLKSMGLFHGTRALMAIHIGSDKLLEKSGLKFKTIMEELALDIEGNDDKVKEIWEIWGENEGLSPTSCLPRRQDDCWSLADHDYLAIA